MWIDTINKVGGKLYIVGGWVADKLVNIIHGTEYESKDIDFVCFKIPMHKLCGLLCWRRFPDTL